MVDGILVLSAVLQPNGFYLVRGITDHDGPFQLSVSATEYETVGPLPAVRHYFAHHPAQLRDRS